MPVEPDRTLVPLHHVVASARQLAELPGGVDFGVPHSSSVLQPSLNKASVHHDAPTSLGKLPLRQDCL